MNIVNLWVLSLFVWAGIDSETVDLGSARMYSFLVHKGVFSRIIQNVDILNLFMATHVPLKCKHAWRSSTKTLRCGKYVPFDDRPCGHVRPVEDRKLLEVTTFPISKGICAHLFCGVSLNVFVEGGRAGISSQTARLVGILWHGGVLVIDHL